MSVEWSVLLWNGLGPIQLLSILFLYLIYIFLSGSSTATIHFTHSLWFGKSYFLLFQNGAHFAMWPMLPCILFVNWLFFPFLFISIFPHLLMVSICTCFMCLLILFCIMHSDSHFLLLSFVLFQSNIFLKSIYI